MDPDQTAPYCRRGSKKFVRGGCSKDLVFSYITIFYEGRRGCTNILSSLLVGQLMMASVIFFFFFFFFWGGGGGGLNPKSPPPPLDPGMYRVQTVCYEFQNTTADDKSVDSCSESVNP